MAITIGGGMTSVLGVLTGVAEMAGVLTEVAVTAGVLTVLIIVARGVPTELAVPLIWSWTIVSSRLSLTDGRLPEGTGVESMGKNKK